MFARRLCFIPEADRQGRKEAHTHAKVAWTHKLISLCNAIVITLSNADSKKYQQHQEFGIGNFVFTFKMETTSILDFIQNGPMATDYL